MRVMFILLLGFGLPALVFLGLCSAEMSDGTRSTLTWLLVFPAIFGGVVLGAWVDSL